MSKPSVEPPSIYTFDEIREFLESKRLKAEHFAATFSPGDMPLRRTERVNNYLWYLLYSANGHTEAAYDFLTLAMWRGNGFF